jgi:3-deoxy-manno-octulosonate cytidylyltransferase (CMP-KDO synthetase)
MAKILAVIPARLGSVRFKNKLIQKINNKPLLQYTFENVKRAKMCTQVTILVDDPSMQLLASQFNANSFLTPDHCINGTHRIQTALKMFPELKEYDLIVNVQGDQPLLESKTIDHLIKKHLQHLEYPAFTLCSQMTKKEALSPHNVKVVFDKNGQALYFSRSLIPYNGKTFFKHIGIYSYTPTFLLELEKWPNTPLQEKENLEQLKIIESGCKIGIDIVKDQSIGVDTKEDFEKVKKILCNQSSYLLQEELFPH